jgi:predicted transposase/invertase (TIGR01784 family)
MRVSRMRVAESNARREDMAQLIERNLSEKESLEYMTIAERERYEGKLENAIETARLMKAKGFPMSDILEITGLSEYQLKENAII